MAAVEGVFQRQQQQFRGGIPINLPIMDPPRVTRPLMEASLCERPASALARGVQITEFKDSRVNPEPVQIEESEVLLEEYLSPRKLRDLTGSDDLGEVEYLEMKVDTRDTSLGNFGTHLPNLSELKLSNSIISSARDLGSSLNSLRVLWMARCGCEDLDGISSMNNLRELYLAYNDICDISPCSMLENLQILDLEGNNIDEISQVHFLNTCGNLTNLTLEGNPVCVTPSPNEASPDYDYRTAVKSAIPHLTHLDDASLIDKPSCPRSTASVFEEDWALIDELMHDGTMPDSDENSESGAFGGIVSRPPTASLRPATGYRPGSALKNYTGTGIRPGTRAGRPVTGAPISSGGNRIGTGGSRIGSGGSSASSGGTRPGSARLGSARPGSARPGTARPGSGSGRPISGEEIDTTDDASDLTRGGVVCGNPSKALRSRQRPQKTQNVTAAKLLAQYKEKSTSEKAVRLESDHDDEGMTDLLSDLSDWRASYREKQKEIDDSKAPQVLRIDHDDAVSLSGDESVDSEEEETHYRKTDHNPSSYAEEFASRSNGFSIKSGALADDDSPRTIGEDVRPKSRKRDPSPRARRKMNQRYDESFDAPEENSPEKNQRSPLHSHRHASSKSRSAEQMTPPSPSTREELRPITGPNIHRSNYRLESPKMLDRANPVIRSSIHSPEYRQLEGQRADTTRNAQSPPSVAPRMRKGLSGVQLLPSKFTK